MSITISVVLKKLIQYFLFCIKYPFHFYILDLAGCFDYLKNNLCFDYKTNYNQASINYFLKDFEKISFDKKSKPFSNIHVFYYILI
jgi:hypothetical protein